MAEGIRVLLDHSPSPKGKEYYLFLKGIMTNEQKRGLDDCIGKLNLKYEIKETSITPSEGLFFIKR